MSESDSDEGDCAGDEVDSGKAGDVTGDNG